MVPSGEWPQSELLHLKVIINISAAQVRNCFTAVSTQSTSALAALGNRNSTALAGLLHQNQSLLVYLP